MKTQLAPALLAKAIGTYYQGTKGQRMVGHAVLSRLGLLEASPALARLTLQNLYSGCPVGGASIEVGNAVINTLAPREEVSFTERACVGSYLISMATFAGLYRMVRATGEDASDTHSFDGDEGHPIHPYDEPWRLVEIGDHLQRSLPPYVSRKPFPHWTSLEDSDGRSLIRTRHLPSRRFNPKAEWVEGVHAVESVGFKINQRMLEIAQKHGSLKSRKKSRSNDEAVLEQAEKLGTQAFYNRAHLDSRGRIYTSRSPVNFQQGDLSRGLLDFAKSVKMSQTGMEGLYLHLANTAGLKGDIDSRIKTAKASVETYKAVGRDPEKHSRVWKKASHPYQFLRACMEIATVGVGDRTNLICEIDQSQSGLAWQAIFMDDPRLAEMTNLLGGYRDLYQEVGDAIALKTTVDGVEVEATADHSHNPALPSERRKLAKLVILPAGYGAGVDTIAVQIAQWAKNNKKDARYTTTLGIETTRDERNDLKASPGITDVARRIKKAIATTAPATKAYAKELKQWYRSRMVVVTAKQYSKQLDREVHKLLDGGDERSPEEIRASMPELPRNLRDYLARGEEMLTEDGEYMFGLGKNNKTGLSAYWTPDEVIDAWKRGDPVGDSQIQWAMPTGFHVVIRKSKEELRRVRVYGFDTPWDRDSKRQHKVVLWEPTDIPDFPAMITSSMADHVHSWDGALVAHVCANAPFSIAPVHDAFGCHANNIFKLQKRLMEGMRYLATFKPLEGLQHQDLPEGPLELDTDVEGFEWEGSVLRFNVTATNSDIQCVDVTARNAFS